MLLRKYKNNEIIEQLLRVQCRCKKLFAQNKMAIVIYVSWHFSFHFATVTHAICLIHKVCMSKFMMAACLNLKKKTVLYNAQRAKEVNCWNKELFFSWIYSLPNKKSFRRVLRHVCSLYVGIKFSYKRCTQDPFKLYSISFIP